MHSFQDYHVVFRGDEVIARYALAWREASAFWNRSYFNIVDYVEQTLKKKLKRGLHIKYFSMGPDDKPAFVTFSAPRKPATLNVDYEIWELARLGDPDARFIIAHEIGHLVLHDNEAKAFSNDPNERIKFARPEYSAEWQANIFAFYLLMPDLIVAAYNDISQLSKACGVTVDVARQRIALSQRFMRHYNSRDCGICPDCGGFTLSSSGSCSDAACSGSLTRMERSGMRGR